MCAWGPILWNTHPGLKLKNREGAGYAPMWPEKALPLSPRNFHSPSLPAPPLPGSRELPDTPSHFKLDFQFTALF